MADKHSEGYQEALKLIEENLETKETELFLGGLNLSKLPSKITILKHLEILELRIGKEYYFGENSFTTFPPEILKLENLLILSLRETLKTELPKEISELKYLLRLYIDGAQITKLPKEISELKNLRTLYLDDTQISEFPKEILKLEKLNTLSLANTKINELPKEISELKNLEFLYLPNARIRELPKEILKLEKLRVLMLRDNHLSIPPEIVNRVNEPQVILNYYFENVVGKDRPLNEIKMLLLGEGEVGKTALVHQLVDNKFKTTGKTEGIDIHKWDVEVKKDCNIQINIWDFAGQEITHATHQFFLTKRSLYLLVLASRGDEKSNRLEEWLKIIQNLGGASPVIIVCNKSDEHQMNLDERALREKYPNIREIVKVSCKKGTNIKALKQKVLKEIRQMPHVFDPFSKKWFNVKQRLEDLNENYIPFDNYLKICDEEGVIEDIDRETLIKFLHDLGVVLNFRDDRRLNDTNVLKPEWITEGVYKILTSKMLDDAHGVLTLEMVGKILEKKKYPIEKHHFIVQMMQKFERCFPLDKSETFLVPDLLPKQQPDFGEWKPEEKGLGFEYHYEIEPGSFITRFIVNMNEYIDKDIYWRKGVVLKNADGNRALVKADLEDKIIFIGIDGKKEPRRGFLSMIRGQFKKIHEKMSNLKVTEFVQHEKGLIPYDSLLKLEEKGIKEHYFPEIDADVNVIEMLNGIETQEERYGRLAEKMRPGFNDLDEFNASFKGRWSKTDYFETEETTKETYDVALSFASEDIWYVSRVFQELKDNKVKVFYYENEQAGLWGENLYDELDDIYRNRSQYVVMFISESYAKKMWTNHERQSAFDRAIQEKKAYVLPARFDNTELKGLRRATAHIDLENMTPKDFAQLIIKKLGKI